MGLISGGYLSFRTKKGEGESLTNSNEGLQVYYCYWTEELVRKVLEEAGFLVESIKESGSEHLAILAKKL